MCPFLLHNASKSPHFLSYVKGKLRTALGFRFSSDYVSILQQEQIDLQNH